MPGWIADDLSFHSDDEWMQRGDTWSQGSGEPIPSVRHPIGFIVGPRKPRVRVKAWTRPIEGDD